MEGGRNTSANGRWEEHINQWKVGGTHQSMEGGRNTSANGRWREHNSQEMMEGTHQPMDDGRYTSAKFLTALPQLLK